MPSPSIEQPRGQLIPAAALAATLCPGLGHFVLGQRRKAILLAASIFGLIASGLFIGGLSVIDRRENRVWFMAQALNGPIVFAIDYVHQSHFKVRDTPNARPRTARPFEARRADGLPIPATHGLHPPYVKSLGRVNEIGVLYVAIAGLLNLIAILDAAFPTLARSASSTTHSPKPAPSPVIEAAPKEALP